jgi:hypothetical protein
MNLWSERLSRSNIDDFFNEYAPSAYRSAYKVLGDTTRAENVLLESFVETYHQRNVREEENPVFIFGEILERRVSHISSKYPLPMDVKVSNRTLDDFTRNSLLSDIHRKIDSIPFRVIDSLSSSASSHHNSHAPRLPKMIGGISKSGMSITLILQLIIVAIVIAIMTFAGAMNIFGIRDIIPAGFEQDEWKIDKKLVSALPYLPLVIQNQPVDFPISDDSESTPSVQSESSTISESDTTTTVVTSDLSATTG